MLTHMEADLPRRVTPIVSEIRSHRQRSPCTWPDHCPDWCRGGFPRQPFALDPHPPRSDHQI